MPIHVDTRSIHRAKIFKINNRSNQNAKRNRVKCKAKLRYSRKSSFSWHRSKQFEQSVPRKIIYQAANNRRRENSCEFGPLPREDQRTSSLTPPTRKFHGRRVHENANQADSKGHSLSRETSRDPTSRTARILFARRVATGESRIMSSRNPVSRI